MATLIGDGGHARDIAAVTAFTHLYPDHDVWMAEGDRLYFCVIGINDPQLRAKVAAEMGVEDIAWIHPDAKLYRGVVVGSGTHVNYGVTVTRTTIGHHCTISPGVTICGDVTIGDRVLVGAGATIGDRVVIGSDVIIGMGAVILPEVVIPSGETWVGLPGRKLK